MLVLDDTGIGNFGISKVHHSITLIVGHIKDFLLKTNRTIFQFAETIIVIFIQFPGVKYLIGNLFPMLTIVKEVDIQLDIHTFEHTINEFIKTSHRNALETVVEIVVVVDKTNR